MGEVYRARDTRLDRDVAIKVLPAVFAQDAERLARFEREAKVLASLNHPHIAQIYGLEEGHGDAGHAIRAIAMELVAGETLEERLARGPIRSMRPCRSPTRSPRHSRPRMGRASFIATSSRRTSR
jgi:serine/threonine-protein kinase